MGQQHHTKPLGYRSSGVILSVENEIVVQRVGRKGEEVEHLASDLDRVVHPGENLDILYPRHGGLASVQPYAAPSDNCPEQFRDIALEHWRKQQAKQKGQGR